MFLIRAGIRIVVVTICVGLLARAGPANAAEPAGEWLVESGDARIRIERCADEMWGLVSWEKEPGATDGNNPDPVRRTRPTLGMPVLLGLKQAAPNRWDGNIYNARDGKTYEANVSLAAADRLRVQGCVLGLLCGGETWTRVAVMPKPDAPGGKPASNRAGGGSPQAGGRPKSTPFENAQEVCKAAAAASGRPALAGEPSRAR
ncbi:DUF2147 domain-containing protein [Chelatococcus reniformis]|uniref:DUF2147 domain-containing protein n=1 Tax=Chelatococcus reniformis TaxID=1494448 RepID=A0A916URW0_9HYPH|nr:DUF2147 domain-containing protein [Chelatococcus reniformis]GGC85302.1 hypothetical protein GCM10010994_48980 [Chelatococcus reniformis]